MNRRTRRAQAKLSGASSRKKGESQFQEAVGHYQGDRSDLAKPILVELLKGSPDHPGALCLLGTIQYSDGKRAEGLEKLRKAVSVSPQTASFHNNLGAALSMGGDYPSARVALECAVALDPKNAEYLSNLSGVLRNLGDMEAGVRAAEKALDLSPQHLGTLTNLANMRDDLGDDDNAIDLYRRVIALQPGHTPALNNLGQILRRHGKASEALDLLYEALSFDKNSANILCNIADCLRDKGQIGNALQFYDCAVNASGALATMHSNGLHALIMGATDPLAVRKAHQDWQQKWAVQCDYDVPVPGETRRNRKIKIGYLSGDLREHSVAYFLEPLWANHSRDRFETFAYRTQGLKDGMTTRLQGIVDQWRDLDGMDDAAVTALIRNDHLDIVIDLSGHTAGNKLRVLSRRVAPVQLSWLGYPATTGLEEIDGRIVDPWTDPAPSSDRHCTEKLIRLPKGFNVYKPSDNAPKPRPGPGATGQGVVFGSFNAVSKVGDSVIECWAELLRQVPGSRLMLKSKVLDDQGARDETLLRFRHHKIENDRVDLIGWLAKGHHLDLYNSIDIALDPFPYNGATTTCEALWMSRPVVSLIGNAHAGRVGYSLLSRLGHEDWCCADLESYVRVAVDLASQPAVLARHHQNLRHDMARSGLTDGAAFAQSFEECLMRFYTEINAGEPKR